MVQHVTRSVTRNSPPAAQGPNNNVSPPRPGQAKTQAVAKGGLKLALPRSTIGGKAQAILAPSTPPKEKLIPQFATPDKFLMAEADDSSSAEGDAAGDAIGQDNFDGITDTQAIRAIEALESEAAAGSTRPEVGEKDSEPQQQMSLREWVEQQMDLVSTASTSMSKFSDDIHSTGPTNGNWFIEPDAQNQVLVYRGTMFDDKNQVIKLSGPQIMLKVVKANPYQWLAMLDFSREVPTLYSLKVTSCWAVDSVNGCLKSWKLTKHTTKGQISWKFEERFKNWKNMYDLAVQEGPVSRPDQLTDNQLESIRELETREEVMIQLSTPAPPAKDPEPTITEEQQVSFL